jgi:hypothetical protein
MLAPQSVERLVQLQAELRAVDAELKHVRLIVRSLGQIEERHTK